MATATVFTAARMLEIEQATVVSGSVDGAGHLILITNGGSNIDAGSVKGPGAESYLDHGTKAGAFTLDTTLAETNFITMGNDLQVTLSNGVNGKSIYIIGSGSYILTVNGQIVPTGRAFAIMVNSSWEIYIISGSGDYTAPTAGTLSVTFPGTDSSLVVAGAADYGVGLHAQPYSFSKDDGATWSGWQTSATYAGFTNLTPVTSYTFKHRVRDAVGNIANGLAVTLTTPVLKTWSNIASDAFSSGSTITGRTTDTGALAWNVVDNAGLISSGMAYWDSTSTSQQYVKYSAQARCRSTVEYDCSTHTTPGARASVGVGFMTNATWNNSLVVTIGTVTNGDTADLQLVDLAIGSWSMTAIAGKSLTGHPATGTLLVDIDFAAAVGTVYVNGVATATITGDTTTLFAYGANLNFQNSTSRALSFLVEKYT